MIKKNVLKYSPIVLEDIKISTGVYGPIIAALKGETTHTKHLQVKLGIIKLPATIKNMHRNVMLYFDIFFFNKIPFLNTLTKNL